MDDNNDLLGVRQDAQIDLNDRNFAELDDLNNMELENNPVQIEEHDEEEDIFN